MTEVIRKYGCDGCFRLFDSMDELTAIEEYFYRGGDKTPHPASDRAIRIYCKVCLDERTARG